MNLLSAQHISVIRSGRAILQDVSLDIARGDFITIIGPNGAGKSTLLQCLMGFFAPDKGAITRASDVCIGYVPQRILPVHTIPITVKRFLTLTHEHDVTAETLTAITEQTQVTPLLQHPLQTLSGGEMQRVLLARALLRSPNLLILDEPAQNLDISSQIAFYALLEQLHKSLGLSIVMVSHDLHLVMASSRKVICLYHHICCSGEPHLVAQDPEFTKLFGKDFTTMMGIYHHQHTHHHDHHHDGHVCNHPLEHTHD